MESKPYDEVKIDQHAAKVGGRRNLREIKIESDGDTFCYLVKKPGKTVIQAIAEAEKKGDITGMQKLMLGCVLEGDMEAVEYDGAIYSQLLKQVSALANMAKSDIKKL